VEQSTPAEELGVEEALELHEFRMIPAAEALGMSRNKLRREMARLGLSRPGDLSVEQIQAALDQSADLASSARALRVSERGLKLRLRELGLTQP
jgi:transcriptional regulator with GAF, ATPase, and Fis domain